jgi:FtsZ-binding cell division protein ZapB
MDSCDWDIDYKQIQINSLEEENEKLKAENEKLEAKVSVLMSTIGTLNLATEGLYFHIIKDMNDSIEDRVKYLIDQKKEDGE